MKDATINFAEYYDWYNYSLSIFSIPNLFWPIYGPDEPERIPIFHFVNKYTNAQNDQK